MFWKTNCIISFDWFKSFKCSLTLNFFHGFICVTIIVPITEVTSCEIDSTNSITAIIIICVFAPVVHLVVSFIELTLEFNSSGRYLSTGQSWSILILKWSLVPFGYNRFLCIGSAALSLIIGISIWSEVSHVTNSGSSASDKIESMLNMNAAINENVVKTINTMSWKYVVWFSVWVLFSIRTMALTRRVYPWTIR